MTQTAKEFFESRNDYLEMRLAPGKYGGFDVVIRVDGAYFSREDAESMLDYWNERLMEIRETEGL